ncbi:GSCOCG00011648001-RA-CDS, partial [Cotesia congregata]
NGDQGEHVKERVKKGARIMGQVWGIGKRNDQLRSRDLGMEGQGRDGETRGKVLKVSSGEAGYLVREELQRDLLEGRAGLRAWSYEKRIGEGGGGLLPWRCKMEMKKRINAGSGLEGWKAERNN